MKPLSFFKETFPYFKQTILTVRLKRAESPKAPILVSTLGTLTVSNAPCKGKSFV